MGNIKHKMYGTPTYKSWSDKTGIKKSTLAQRIYVYKWSLEKTLQKGGY